MRKPGLILALAASCLIGAATIASADPLMDKVTLDESTPSGPSLVSLGECLYVAWNGTDGAHKLQVMSSCDDGKTFANKYTSEETSPKGPSLAVHNDNLYIAWTGTGNQSLNVAKVDLKDKAVAGFSQKVTLAETSASAPALASIKGRLYVAWNGTDETHRLNVMSAGDDLKFGNKHTSEETSPEAPSLAVHKDWLYIAWKGTGNKNVNVAIVNRQGDKVANLAQIKTLEEASFSTPSLASRGANLFLVWNGTDDAHKMNIMSSSDNGLTFLNKYTSAKGSPNGPSLAVHNEDVFIAWQATGSQSVNVAKLNVVPATRD